MPVSKPKDSAITNAPMGLNDISRSIPWDYHFSRSALKPTSAMIKDWLNCWATISTTSLAKPVNIRKITILHRRRLSPGYHPQRPATELPASDDQDQISTRTQTHESRKSGTGESGICPSCNKGGGSERSNAWMERCKSLVKNSEAHLESCNSKTQSVFHSTDA